MNGTPIRPSTSQAGPLSPAPHRLLDQLRQAARQCCHPEPTVAVFTDGCRRFILFDL